MRKPRQTEEHRKRLAIYRDMIEASKQWRACYKPEWDACMEVYLHEHYFARNTPRKGGQPKPLQDTYSVNMIHQGVNTTVASSFVGKVDIRFEAKRAELVKAARLRSRVATCMWEDLDFSEPTKMAYKDEEIIGHGWVKLRWEYASTTRRLSDDELSLEVLKSAAMHGIPLGAGPLSSPESFAHDLGIERVKKTVDVDEPRLEYVHYEHMLCDPFAPDMDNIRWIAQQVFIPLPEAKERGIWDKEARECITVSNMDEIGKVRGDSIGDGLTEHDEDCMVEVIEFYDLRNGTMCHFTCDGNDRFLLPPVTVPAPHHHPFVRKDGTKVGGRFYPMSKTQVAKGQQLAFDKIRTEQLRSLQHWVRQYMAPLSLKKHNPEVAAAIEGQNSDVLLWVEDDDFERMIDSGGNFLLPRPTPQIPSDFYAMGPQVRDDFELTYGLSEAFLGAQSNPYESATATSISNAGQQIRASETTQSIQDFIATIAGMMMDYVAAFQQGDQEVGLHGQNLVMEQLDQGVGIEGAALSSPENPGFAKYNRYDLGPPSGRNRFRIVVSAKPPETVQSRRRAAIEMVTGLVPLAQVLVAQGAMTINWQALIEHYLRDGFDMNYPELFIPELGPQVAPETQPNTPPGGPARAGSGDQPGAPSPQPESVLAGLNLNFN